MSAPSATVPLNVMVRRLVDDLTGNVLTHVELLGVEARGASAALGPIALRVAVAALLLSASWILLIATAVVGMVALGVPVYAALGIVAVLCLVAGFALAWSIRPRLAALQFPATRRQLRRAIDARAAS